MRKLVLQTPQLLLNKHTHGSTFQSVQNLQRTGHLANTVFNSLNKNWQDLEVFLFFEAIKKGDVELFNALRIQTPLITQETNTEGRGALEIASELYIKRNGDNSDINQYKQIYECLLLTRARLDNED